MSNIIFHKDELARRAANALQLSGVSLAEALAVVHRKARAEAPAAARSYSICYGYTTEAGKPVVGPTIYVHIRVRYFTGAREGLTRLPAQPRTRPALTQIAAAIACLIILLAPRTFAQAGGARAAERKVEDVGRRIDNVTYEVGGWKQRARRIKGTVAGRPTGQRTGTRQLPPPVRSPARCQPPPAANSNGNWRPRRVCT